MDLSVSLLSDDTYGATGAHSFSAGYLTKASGNFSTALGINASANGSNSIALGDTSSAVGYRSFAAGYFSIAEGQSSVAIGESASSIGISAIAFGKGTQANGDYSLSTGNFTIAGGVNSAAFGVNTNASGASSIAFGTSSGTSGTNAFAGGYESLASGDYSIALGYQTEANNIGAIALGRSTLASGSSSFATGIQTTASGEYATAMGLNSIASGDRATAIGVGCDAIGYESLALGSSTLASGTWSTAMGRGTTASEGASTAMGSFTIADDGASTVVGKYNDNTSSTTTLFQIGNGLNLSNRTNAFTVLENGYASVGTHDEEPNTDFQVYHDNGGTENGFKLLNKGVNKNWWRFYTLNSNGDLYMYSKSGGNASAVGSFNDVSGAYTALSDRRLKDDFKDLYFNWESFMQLKPLTYHYKTDKNKQLNIGFIAQDVEPIYPELVNYNIENDLYQLNYSGFGVVAIKAIQDLKSEVNALSGEIKKLKTLLVNQEQDNIDQTMVLNTLLKRVEALEKETSSTTNTLVKN
ncbi:MAG: hypothetical protein GYB35_08050 [Algicola sp.]|nr:hypothetical protein [Algicola sp.]